MSTDAGEEVVGSGAGEASVPSHPDDLEQQLRARFQDAVEGVALTVDFPTVTVPSTSSGMQIRMCWFAASSPAVRAVRT